MTPKKSLPSVDRYAETDIMPAVEPVELDKRLPFLKDMEGMNALMSFWKKFWRYYE
jgi:hypothetical protein